MKSKFTRGVLAAIVISAVLSLPCPAAEYFVSKTGADTNNGLSKAAAFLTIQKGVDALKAGDTLTICPGEYFENVKHSGLGSDDVDTIIRAEIPGTAVLRGDIPAPEFKKVDGYRFVYAARFDRKPNVIFERNTMHTLVAKANVAELEFDPGFFHYDATAKMLYISNLDLSAADQGRYTLTVNGNSGLELTKPTRVVIEGLAATGFNPGWGILLFAPESCVVRDCVSYMNVGGICLQHAEDGNGSDCGSNNLVENCIAYGSSFGGIVRYKADNDIIRNCYTYRNGYKGEHFGVMHYYGMKGPLLIKNNISWGQSFDYSIKPNSDQPGRLEGCVGLGFIRNSKMFHNLIGGGNESDRGSNAAAHNILFLREQNLDKNLEFADHLNLDFRLQPDSRFRNSAPDGSDRGPYQYEANIFYVSPAGSDQADGLSVRKPWRTLKHAFKKLRPGDTLYLTAGEYFAAVLEGVGDGKSPVRILGRGRGTVVIKGRQTVTGGAGVTFERLNFSGGFDAADSRGLTFKNCTFFGPSGGLDASNVQGLKVTHSVFAGAAVSVNRSSGVFLSGNLYANADSPSVILDTPGAIAYSDYNNYQNAAHCWSVNDAKWSFANLQRNNDRYSKTLSPQLIAVKGVPCLKSDSRFVSTGPNNTAMGIHQEYQAEPKPLSLVGPFVHSVSDTTVNIEWWSSKPAAFSLAWGQSPEMTGKQHRLKGDTRFNTYSLTDLKPGTEYYFKITSVDASSGNVHAPILTPKDAAVSFKTASRPAPSRTYYVAPDGNDANRGTRQSKALRTISRAAAMVGPGDTVLIAGGDYNETVRIRAAGTKDRPITYRCIEGQKAVLRCEDLQRSFEVIAKGDNRFDGLYFRGRNFWAESFIVRSSPRVHITRCLDTMVSASHSPGMVVRNCVLQGGWTSVRMSNCADSVVENNVFIMAILSQFSVHENVIMRRNIFCENQRNKTHSCLAYLSKGVTETDNCFYMRWPVGEKLAVNNMPLPVYKIRSGSNSFAANPMMPAITGFRAGWQRTTGEDFDGYFATNPTLVLRGIGLQPKAFSDFKFKEPKWRFDLKWASSVDKAMLSASKLIESGKNKAAMNAYVRIAKKFLLSDRLKADVLEKAFYCAERLKDYDRAMELAKAIPVEVLSVRAQMRVLLARKQYAELLKRFDKGPKERRYYIFIVCPEMEDVVVDIYHLRSQAYVHTGNLAAAEADLKVVNDNRFSQQYTSGEAVHDLAWLRLGDFYRLQLKDDQKALEAYLKVCSRTTWARWGTVPKPVSTGATETLVKATKEACDILREQGKLDEVRNLQSSLAKAQADAKAALVKK